MENVLLFLSFIFLGGTFYFFYRIKKDGSDQVFKNFIIAIVCLVIGGLCVRCSIDSGEKKERSANNSYYQDSNNSGGSNVSFKGQTPPNHSTDGYIFQGGVKYNGYQVYKKGGHTYYWDHKNDVWVKIK